MHPLTIPAYLWRFAGANPSWHVAHQTGLAEVEIKLLLFKANPISYLLPYSGWKEQPSMKTYVYLLEVTHIYASESMHNSLRKLPHNVKESEKKSWKPTNPPANLQTNQPTNQLINQPTYKLTNQQTNQLTKQPRNLQSTKPTKPTNGHGWKHDVFGGYNQQC